MLMCMFLNDTTINNNKDDATNVAVLYNHLSMVRESYDITGTSIQYFFS